MTAIVKTQKLVPAEIAEKVIKLTELKKQITEQLDELKAQLLEFTQANDVYTLKTGSYTISRGKRQTITILDHKAAFDSLSELFNEPTMIEVLSPSDQKMVSDLVKKGKQIKGTTHQTTEYISIKVAKE